MRGVRCGESVCKALICTALLFATSLMLGGCEKGVHSVALLKELDTASWVCTPDSRRLPSGRRLDEPTTTSNSREASTSTASPMNTVYYIRGYEAGGCRSIADRPTCLQTIELICHKNVGDCDKVARVAAMCVWSEADGKCYGGWTLK
eukprot:TRINITY_DN68011_c0_g1_i1.p1 TRINITY_DN68011_c0_g1~~TRINITY_DN68011_c0_g1_i1.p1  ORF type:complete len:148 (+),score=13.89 TRINITY_DN68011_c0_g1_i1:59-502(+)